MELKFEEVNNLGNQTNINYEPSNVNNNSTSQIKYWEQPKIERRKKVTFDDILNNMNLVVTQDGVLQHMRPISQEQTHYSQQNDYQYQTQYQAQYQTQYQTQYQKPSNKNEQIDPSVKHSYIYNKYFKGYNDVNVEPFGPRRPKTIHELKQMLRDDKIKEIQQRIRLSQIKPKRMLYTNINGIQPTKNNLRVMSFK
jgi:hypothetical protein